MNFTKLAFILAFGILIPAFYGANEIAINRQQQLHQIFTDSAFSGTVLVTQNGRQVFHKSYGFAVKEWQIPNTASTKFRIASLSKTFTEVIIMQLAEEGHLDIDKPLKHYLPDFQSEYAGEVTLRHLLTHRTGIPRFFNIPGWSNGQSLSPHTKESFLSMIASLPTEFKANSQRLYSSANYYLLGAVIEKVTGQSFGQILQENILKPLNMKNTDVYRPGQLVEGLASPYKRVCAKYSFCPQVEGEFCLGGKINLGLFLASGSMHSTAEDLAIWAKALDDEQLLSAESQAFLFSANTKASWHVQKGIFEHNQSLTLLVADGDLEGNSSMLLKLPEAQISVVILNNTGIDYQHKAELGLKIIEVLLD